MTQSTNELEDDKSPESCERQVLRVGALGDDVIAEIESAEFGRVDSYAFYEWLRSNRLRPKGRTVTSVELLNQIYDEPIDEAGF